MDDNATAGRGGGIGLFASLGEPLGTIVAEMLIVAGQMKTLLGHDGHDGWSTMVAGYRIDPGGYGYPADVGDLTLCGCGEILSAGANAETLAFDQAPRVVRQVSLRADGEPHSGATFTG